MRAAVQTRSIEAEQAELTILKTLSYFDIFHYPLSEQEIWMCSAHRVTEHGLKDALHKLHANGAVFTWKGFYSLRNDTAIVEKRLQGNQLAAKLIPKAAKIGRFIFCFPYVRAVAVSGSLSKNYADEGTDIDFFIITASNRLWIARTLLHLFKKFTFLSGRQHFYCMNYFIDEYAMAIEDRNIYTAIEIMTLLPIAGTLAMDRFMQINDWTSGWLPCYPVHSAATLYNKRPFVKRAVEKSFGGGFGVWLDEFLFRWTTRRWDRKEKQGRINSKGKLMNLLTGKHFSKSNPEAFQEKVVAIYEQKIQALRNRLPQYFD